YQITVDENSLLALIKNASKRWIPSHLALVKGVMKGNFKKHRKEIFQLFNLGFNGAQNEFYKDINELKAFYYRYWQRYPYEADKELAFKYLNEARKAQQPMAMTDWAIINLDNQNEQAHKLLKLAAQAQEPTANAFLGSLYLSTDSGFTRNEAQALKHLRAACSSKIVTSCYQLGTLLSESYDIPRNLNTAFKHLSYAAFNKHANALEKALNLARLHPSIVVPSTLKKLQKIARQIESTSSNIDAPVKRPWQVLLDRSMKTDDQSEKSKLLDLSRKSLLNEPVEGFELNYNQHQIEHESFKLQISSNPFDTLDQMKSSWELLQISQATKTLKNFFLFDGIKVNWGNNLKRLERLERSLELHYRLQSMRIYEDSYEFWKTNFDAIDEYFSSLISYKRAHKNLTGLSSDKFETTLRHRRAEIALRLASIDHELGHLEACKQWVAKAKKDNHPIHQLVQGRMLVSAEVNLRNDTLAWQLLIDSAGTSPHIDSQSSLPLPGGKAESLLLLSKMVANRRSPKKYWGKKHEYMFLKAACYFQPRYKHLLTKLGKQIDPRLALQAEKLAYRWIKNGDK
ncbi:MAG: tetratricopeptide repeat protein, partial [bacterium]|nr:tetratricopeptide repeat protein [bacterium]